MKDTNELENIIKQHAQNICKKSENKGQQRVRMKLIKYQKTIGQH